MTTREPPAAPSSAHLLSRIRSLKGDLAPAERLVADWVLADPPAAAQLSITALAEVCGVSETTVVRFCRHVGFEGYRPFRMALIATAARHEPGEDADLGGDIARDDPTPVVVKKIGASETQAIEDTVAQLDVDALDAAVTALAAAPRIEVFGVGASGLVAEDLQQKLHRIGQPVFASRDPHAALTSAALLSAGDVAIAISHTGKTRDTLDPLLEASRRGATTVAITNSLRSPIAREADHVLITSNAETTFRPGAMSSRIAQLVVVDCLFVGVAQRSYDETLQALSRTFDAVLDRRERQR